MLLDNFTNKDFQDEKQDYFKLGIVVFKLLWEWFMCGHGGTFSKLYLPKFLFFTEKYLILFAKMRDC